MPYQIRLLQIINIAFSKINIKKDKELYIDIMKGIVCVESKSDVIFNTNELITIIRIVYRLLTGRIDHLSLKKLNPEMKNCIMLISEIIFSGRLDAALNITTLLPSQFAEEVSGAE